MIGFMDSLGFIARKTRFTEDIAFAKRVNEYRLPNHPPFLRTQKRLNVPVAKSVMR